MRKRLKKKLGIGLRCKYCGCKLTAKNWYAHYPYRKDREWWKEMSKIGNKSCDECVPF